MSWVNVTIIVPAASAPLARSLAQAIAGPSGARMFIRELAPAAAGPATHFISSGSIQPQFADMLSNPAAIAAASQGRVSLAQAQALVDSATVQHATQEIASATLQRMGLVFVSHSI